MELEVALGKDLSPVDIPIEHLYLDPANPRFAPTADYVATADEIRDEGVQRSLQVRIVKQFAVAPLMDSIETNGYLPIDRIVVREFDEDSYVVLEGNRRVAAVKELLTLEAGKQRELAPEIRETLLVLPALKYIGDADLAAWIFQGIRHISGIRDWPAFNKARLLIDQMESTGAKYAEAGRIFGLSARAAGQYARAYMAYSQAAEHPEYSAVVDDRAFPYFQELFGPSNVALRHWLKWSDEGRFEDDERFSTFLSWLYPPPDEESEEPEEPRGWEQRRIPRAIDLRDLTDLLADHPHEFAAFEQGSSLSAALGRARARETSTAETAKVVLEEVQDFSDRAVKLPIVEIAESDVRDEFRAVVDKLIERLQSVLKHLQ